MYINTEHLPVLTLIFVSSAVLVSEVVAETFSDVRCPLALVLDSPLSPLQVLPVHLQIMHLPMVKHILKFTKKRK
jgi:hypothetical protein